MAGTTGSVSHRVGGIYSGDNSNQETQSVAKNKYENARTSTNSGKNTILVTVQIIRNNPPSLDFRYMSHITAPWATRIGRLFSHHPVR